MSKKPTISVVIVAGPGRDGSIIRCISSVLQSSYHSFEIIVVDNSQNFQLREKILKLDKNIRYIALPENTGIFGFNVGFANAKGKYIFALDDDAQIEQDTLSRIVAYFQRSPKNVAILTLNQIDPVHYHIYYHHYIKLSLRDVLTFVGGACVFRKEVFKYIGYYDKDFFCWVHEDDLAALILDKGYTIRFVEDIKVFHYEDFTLRPFKYVMIFRNKIWFMVKHFPIWMFPVIFCKDFVWFFTISPLRVRSGWGLWYYLKGTLWGILTVFHVLKKRKVISKNTQRKYLTYYSMLIRLVIKQFLSFLYAYKHK